MFKSKGFTIGFIILCAVNLLLLAGLIYVLSGRADKNMDKFVHKTTEAGQGTKAPTGSIPDETGVTENAHGRSDRGDRRYGQETAAHVDHG